MAKYISWELEKELQHNCLAVNSRFEICRVEHSLPYGELYSVVFEKVPILIDSCRYDPKYKFAH